PARRSASIACRWASPSRWTRSSRCGDSFFRSAGMNFTLKVHGRIAQIGRDAWDACAGPTGDPFVTHDFLNACEEAECAVEAQGWGPRHLTLRGPGDAVLGVMPLYLKGHSQGEYVFDHAWADAYERAGGRY